MTQFSRLMLLAQTPLAATPAFARAVRMAEATGAELHIAAFSRHDVLEDLATLGPEARDTLRSAYVRDVKSAAQRFIESLVKDGLKVRLEFYWNTSWVEQVLECVTEVKPDVVLKDASHESALQRLLLRPLDWELLNRCPAPVWFVNPQARGLPSRVIAAVDGRVEKGGYQLDDTIVEGALALARQCEADITLAHVEVDTTGMPTGLFGEVGMVDAYRELLRLDHEHFRELAERHGVPVDRRRISTGPVASALAAMARDAEGDVLVIGAARRGRMERLLIGRTATDVLESAPCDVLVLKPEGFAVLQVPRQVSDRMQPAG